MKDDRKLSKITGVYVDEIKVETPPYDEPGVVQEFVGQGVSRDYLLNPVQNVTEGKIEGFLESAKDMIDVRGDRFRMRYSLLVRARSRRSAKMKGKAYVRLVNPFSPEVIKGVRSVETTRHADIVEGIDPTANFYDVVIEVSK